MQKARDSRRGYFAALALVAIAFVATAGCSRPQATPVIIERVVTATPAPGTVIATRVPAPKKAAETASTNPATLEAPAPSVRATGQILSTPTPPATAAEPATLPRPTDEARTPTPPARVAEPATVPRPTDEA